MFFYLPAIQSCDFAAGWRIFDFRKSGTDFNRRIFGVQKSGASPNRQISAVEKTYRRRSNYSIANIRPSESRAIIPFGNCAIVSASLRFSEPSSRRAFHRRLVRLRRWQVSRANLRTKIGKDIVKTYEKWLTVEGKLV